MINKLEEMKCWNMIDIIKSLVKIYLCIGLSYSQLMHDILTQSVWRHACLVGRDVNWLIKLLVRGDEDLEHERMNHCIASSQLYVGLGIKMTYSLKELNCFWSMTFWLGAPIATWQSFSLITLAANCTLLLACLPAL